METFETNQHSTIKSIIKKNYAYQNLLIDIDKKLRQAGFGWTDASVAWMSNMQIVTSMLRSAYAKAFVTFNQR